MTNKTHYIIHIIAAVAILLLSLCLYRSCSKPLPEPSVIVKHDTTYIHHTDTIFKPKPYPKYIRTIDTVYIPEDTVLYVEQKMYEDTFSMVWVSGINPSVDSIRHYIPRDTVLVNTETTTTIVQKKKISFGLHLGLGGGYGLIIQQQPQFSPYIGIHGSIGLNYNF